MKRGLEESVSNIDDEENEKKRCKDTPHIFQVGLPFLDAIPLKLYHLISLHLFHFSLFLSWVPLPFSLIICAFKTFLFLPDKAKIMVYVCNDLEVLTYCDQNVQCFQESHFCTSNYLYHVFAQSSLSTRPSHGDWRRVSVTSSLPLPPPFKTPDTQVINLPDFWLVPRLFSIFVRCVTTLFWCLLPIIQNMTRLWTNYINKTYPSGIFNTLPN